MMPPYNRPKRGGKIDYNMQQILYYLGPMTSEELRQHMASVSTKFNATQMQIVRHLIGRHKAIMMNGPTKKSPKVWASSLDAPVGAIIGSAEKVDIYISERLRLGGK